MADRAPSLPSRLVWKALIAAFRSLGLTINGPTPTASHCILIGAPHTSNWDFVTFLGMMDHFGIRPRFMGKTALFNWPMTRFMYDMGGVPVDRSARHNYVDQVAAEFARHDQFQLVIAPDGTRNPTGGWRTGFYHIARKANVPIGFGWVDYERKQCGVSPLMEMTGDFAADMQRISDFYQSVMPGHPRLEALRLQAAQLNG